MIADVAALAEIDDQRQLAGPFERDPHRAGTSPRVRSPLRPRSCSLPSTQDADADAAVLAGDVVQADGGLEAAAPRGTT